MVVGVTAGLVAALLFGAGAVVQAHAVRRHDERRPTGSRGVRAPTALRDPLTMLVVAMYLAGFVLHAVAIWMTPLYLAQATVAMSLPVTAVASMVLHERLTPVHWSALAVVTAGLVLLALGSGEPGEVIVHRAVRRRARRRGARRWPLAGPLGRPGWAAARWAPSPASGTPGPRSPSAACDASVDPLVVGAALAVPAFSLVAFWLYSLGMERGAGLVGHRAADRRCRRSCPALVGVALLGDEVRAGWWPAVVAGLVLATGGRVLLQSGDQLRSPAAAATGSSPDPAR